MGHRCCYAIREDGKISIFYSHWGALSVPQDVFWGPAFAERFIREHDPTDEWLDNVFGEGGVGLDKDTSTCVWYGGEELGYEPLLDPFLKLMQALWREHGWQVRFAENGMTDIAVCVGADPRLVEPEPTEPWVAGLEEATARVREERFVCCLFRIKHPDNDTVQELVGGLSMVHLLLNGAEMLARLDELPTLEEVRGLERRRRSDFDPSADEGEVLTLAEEISDGAFIDLQHKQILMVFRHDPYRTQLDDIKALGLCWPGWDIQWQVGSLEVLYRGSRESLPSDLVYVCEPADEEEEPEEPALSREQELEQIAAVLLDASRKDMVSIMKQIMKGNKGSVCNPNALNNPRSGTPNREQARELFQLAVQALDEA